MSNSTTQRLPSLAHPLVTNPYPGVVEAFLPEQRLPYPEIDPAWDGFELSHLVWRGFKVSLITKGRKLTDDQEAWLFDLTQNHENCHFGLSDRPFSLAQKVELYELNNRIVETLEEGREPIVVPLDPDVPHNALEEQWVSVVTFQLASQLVHEVVAVRISLLNTPGKGRVSHDFRKRLLAKWSEKYEEYIPGFTEVYEIFDGVAGKIGEATALVMIKNVFNTAVPNKAFACILLHLMTKSEDFLRSLATLPDEEADHYFTRVTDAFDPDDSRLQRKSVMEIAPKYERMLNIRPRMTQEGGFNFSFGSRHALLISIFPFKERYSNFNLILRTEIHLRGDDFEHTATYEDIHGNYTLLIEAMRQQLTQGIGLVCPFWAASYTCCSDRNRAFLEKVWARTCPASNCTFWQRLGCLRQ